MKWTKAMSSEAVLARSGGSVFGSWVSCFVLAALVVAFVSSCDTGSRNSGDGGPFGGGRGPFPGGGGGGGNITAPILFSVEPDSVCPGQLITLRGINFDPELSRNEVLFRFGTRFVRGVPTTVAFPSDPNLANGRDSLLRVIVPTGVSTGTVELNIRGFFAGAVGYIACPQIIGFEIGANRQETNLINAPPLGFDSQFGPDVIWIHGLNFSEVNEVFIEDSSARRVPIPQQIFRRRRIDPDNGLDSISFDLQTAKLSTDSPRDNIKVWVSAENVISNVVSVPVQLLDDAGRPLGPVINGVRMPLGVRTGNVRLDYSFYDRPITMSYLMQFEWSVDGGDNWFPAELDMDDPESDGTQPNLPGIVLPGALAYDTEGTILRGGGQVRTFSWDAPNDPAFRTLNETPLANGDAAPRSWSVRFRVRALPSFDDGSSDRFDFGILFETAPMAYYDLEPRFASEDLSTLRSGFFQEEFDDSALRDDNLTTALWGPPFSRGSLEGKLEDRAVSRYGEGTFDLEMVPIPDPPPTLLDQFFEIDTTRMAISRVLVTQDPDLGDQIEEATRIFPPFGDDNPGADDLEFHLRSWVIADGMRVETSGNNPLVVRLSGIDLDNEDVVFENGGVIDASAQPDPARDSDEGAELGRLGGGNGGNGATLTGDAIQGVTAVTLAGDGGNNGGQGGETPGAFDPTPQAQQRFNASPGGGGGARFAGGDGDPGNPRPEVFPTPNPGRGGPPRGSNSLRPLLGGSGGGGGGASPLGDGSAGGGGGGAVRVIGKGSFLFTDTGRILANGGDGVPADRGAPGGGGSGGSVLLQATGFVSVTCDSIEVNGGLPGDGPSTLNRPAGAGEGSPGWVRIESGFGGTPFCNFLPVVRTQLSSTLRNSPNTSTIDVDNATDFPDSGKVRINGEIISYSGKAATELTGVARGADGTDVQEHASGSVVELLAVVSPAESFVGGDIQEAPDVIDTRLGLDQALHTFFVPSRDPFTGELLRDEDGNVLSIWTFDTDRGVVLDPGGFIVKRALGSSEDPGLLQLTRLTIDPGVTLRGVGNNPMRILVTEIADIGGRLDVSGSPGGLLRFDGSNPEMPAPGLGGVGGPGGADGGTGGTVIFLDGDLDNKARENIDGIDALNGGLPPLLPEEFDVTPVDFEDPAAVDSLVGMEVIRARGGGASLDAACEVGASNTCSDSAGGGAGGGHLESGADGDAIGDAWVGIGGSPLGSEALRFNGSLLLLGGGGGSGGGGSAAVSSDYEDGQAGVSIFRGRARFAPGTGGGGGGGVLHLAVQGSLLLRSTGSILSNGGDAYQSIDLGGNGGAGAGGAILIQVANAFTVEPGATIEARGGDANRPVPREPGQTLPLYEGNIRRVNGTATVFGGLGGDGAPGRIRLEAPRNSVLLRGGGINSSYFGGIIAANGEESRAFSRPFNLGVGPGRAVLAHELEIVAETVAFGEFGLPIGTRADVVYQGAPQSIDVHGTVGRFSSDVPAVDMLRNLDFVRFHAELVSNNIVRAVPSIRRIRIEYRMPESN